jgi:Ni/Fe-hydrogenase 1 B-type cytochrome subunit
MTATRVSLKRDVVPAQGHYQWVYLWGWPIRAMHWVAALCVVALTVTGLYIGRPYFMTGEGGNPYVMGWMRTVHFWSAALLVMTGIVRVYWLFAGNRFERLAALFPVRPRDWVNMVKQVKYYLMIQPRKAPRYLGHNPLQQLSYTFVYLVVIVMVVTGFTLYGQGHPTGFWYSATNWLVPYFGGIQYVRWVHHVGTWLFLIFIPIHVYLAIRADLLERGGVVSSIVTGGRFVPKDATFVDE